VTPHLRVLFVEDRADDAALLVAELRRFGYQVSWARVDTYASLESELATVPDLVVSDYALPGMDVLEVLSRVRAALPDIPVIVISGEIDEERGVALFRHGASDLLLKDRLARLGPAVAAVLDGRRLATEVRRSAERERRTAELLSALVDHAPSAICVQGPDGVPLVTNARYRALATPAQRDTLAGLFDPGNDAGDDAGGPSGSREIDLADGTFLTQSFPIEDSARRPLGRGLILMDITRQKLVERELRSVRAELQQQARELRASNAELVELDRLKTDLVSTVSHELRTPLTSIVGYCELLGDDEAEGPQSTRGRMIETISRNSTRLLELIDNLLLLARMDGSDTGHPAEPPGGVVLLSDLAHAVTAVVLPSVTKAQLTLRTVVDDDRAAVTGDAGELERVLMNLVSNAVKFSSPGGAVTIRVRRMDDTVAVEVSDQGIGMSPEELRQIGSRFFRSESARVSHIQGTGLGVSVVRSIIERHGGRVEYTSRPGEGTTVNVLLPAAIT
jgi:signal transduction histidine kinase